MAVYAGTDTVTLKSDIIFNSNGATSEKKLEQAAEIIMLGANVKRLKLKDQVADEFTASKTAEEIVAHKLKLLGSIIKDLGLIIEPGNNGDESKIKVIDDSFKNYKYITMTQLSEVPSGLNNLKYGVSADNKLILFRTEGDILKVVHDHSGNNDIEDINLRQAISNDKYLLISGKRMPDGRIEIGNDKVENLNDVNEKTNKLSELSSVRSGPDIEVELKHSDSDAFIKKMKKYNESIDSQKIKEYFQKLLISIFRKIEIPEQYTKLKFILQLKAGSWVGNIGKKIVWNDITANIRLVINGSSQQIQIMADGYSGPFVVITGPATQWKTITTAIDCSIPPLLVSLVKKGFPVDPIVDTLIMLIYDEDTALSQSLASNGDIVSQHVSQCVGAAAAKGLGSKRRSF